MAKKKKTPPVINELTSMLIHLKGESDRGMVLIVMSWVDDALENLLKTRMIADDKILKNLFEPDRSLGSFSTRINLAYALGMIGRDVFDDLDTTRSIRNDFAHDRNSLSFSTQSVKDRCKNLKLTRDHVGDGPDKVSNPRDQFLLTALLLIGFCITLGESGQRPTWSALAGARFISQTLAAINKMVVDMTASIPG